MIAIVDYGMGNLHSIAKALEYVGAHVVVTSSADVIRQADRLVLPGIGAFRDGIQNLREGGLIPVLQQEVVKRRKPFLGICLGMQLLATRSFEFGEYAGLGLVSGEVVKFDLSGKGDLRVPHVGWNNAEQKIASPLWNGIANNADFYFVHSYHFVVERTEEIAATCDYGGNFVAALQKDNIFATQFHPEKSQKDGLKLLENFLTWNAPTC